MPRFAMYTQIVKDASALLSRRADVVVIAGRRTRRLLETKLTVAVEERRTASARLDTLRTRVAAFRTKHPNCVSSLATAVAALKEAEEALRDVRDAICAELVQEYGDVECSMKSEDAKAAAIAETAELARVAMIVTAGM